MNFPDRFRNSPSNPGNGTTDTGDRDDMEILGGEPLESSGFEDETPLAESETQFKPPQHSRKGGHK